MTAPQLVSLRLHQASLAASTLTLERQMVTARESSVIRAGGAGTMWLAYPNDFIRQS
jgi:hypothetical protein